MENNEKELTGYPHIDRPWMKYYDKDKISLPNPEANLTKYLKQQCSNWRNEIASTYYGNETTYQELFQNIDNDSKVLNQLGVKQGDIIMNLMPNIPETGEIWLGATQIGAISDFIDPRPDSMDIKANAKKILELLQYEKAKHIIALDKCYLGMLKPIEHELKDLGITKIITVSATDRMNILGQISYLKDIIKYNELRNEKNKNTNAKQLKNIQALLGKIKTMQKENELFNESKKHSPLEILKFSDLVKDCVNSTFTTVDDVNAVNYIGHTSGTSGARPKPIALTNKNGISTLQQLIKGNVNFEVGDKALHVLPFFAPFGTYDNWLLNLVSGANNIDVPEFEINEFGYLILKYKPNVIMATPAWISALPKCKYLQNVDLSFIKKIIFGGDSMTKEDQIMVNNWLKSHGSQAEVETGHGMSEFGGCGSYAQKEYNEYESIGIPLPETIYTIVDPNIEEKLVPLKFENNMEKLEGELVVSSDAVTNGKLHGDTIVPRYEMNGKSYIRTRDIVQMDKNGIFYHKSRKDRSFSRFDGYKYKPYEVEKIIENNENIKYVRITPYYDERKRGIMPICHIVLNNENISYEEKMKIIEEIVYVNIIGNPDMSSRQIPSKFRIRNEMPISKNGKVDFNSLIQEGLDGSEINVDVKETNLSVDSIDIYSNEQETKLALNLIK